jgi:hypothetical protein
VRQTRQLIDRAMALNDLAAAAEDADAGGSLYPLASGLVEPALARVAPEEGMRLVSAMRPRTWLRLDAELRAFAIGSALAISGSNSPTPHGPGPIRSPYCSSPAPAMGVCGSVPC